MNAPSTPPGWDDLAGSGAGRWLLTTENSTYELDLTATMIRRLRGSNPTTAYQGCDGEWRTYETVLLHPSGLVTIWHVEPAGEDLAARYTRTSPIVEVRRVT